MDALRWGGSNNQSGFDPVGINSVCDCPGVMLLAGRHGRNKYAHDTDLNNLGPRAGFGYRAGEKLVIRAGYGVNYNGAYSRAVPFTQFWTFSRTLDINSPDGGFTPAFMLSDGLPRIDPFTEEDRVGTFGATVSGRCTVSPDFIQQNQQNGDSQQWNLTLQKQLPDNVLLEAQYQANVGHSLGGPNYNFNMIPLTGGTGPDRQSQALRLFPHYNAVVVESPDWGNSTYHSLNLKAEKRFSSDLSYLFNYTWSKFIDDVESANELGGEQHNSYTHFQLRHLDKALSGNDVRHRLVASGVYELPVGRGKAVNLENPVANAVIGGWSLGVIAEFRTGAPYGIIEQTNRSNAFSHGQRPNRLGDPHSLWRPVQGGAAGAVVRHLPVRGSGSRHASSGTLRGTSAAARNSPWWTSRSRSGSRSPSGRGSSSGGLLQPSEPCELQHSGAPARQLRVRAGPQHDRHGTTGAARPEAGVLGEPQPCTARHAGARP